MAVEAPLTAITWCVFSVWLEWSAGPPAPQSPLDFKWADFNCSTLVLFFSSHAVGDSLLCLVCCWMRQFQGLSVGQITSPLTLEYFGIQWSLWSTQWPQGALVLWLLNKPQSSPVHLCADMRRFIFSKRGALNYGQTSPFSSHLFKWLPCFSGKLTYLVVRTRKRKNTAVHSKAQHKHAHASM